VNVLTRVTLVLGSGLVGWLALVVEPDDAARRFGGRRAGGHTLEGRVELTDDVVALCALPDVPGLTVRVVVPGGVLVADVEDNGRFWLEGLPAHAVDLEVRVGVEVLARLEGVTPNPPSLAHEDTVMPVESPPLGPIALAGPLHRLELQVLGAEGRPIEGGWLAWRSSPDRPFEAVASVVAGAASFVSLAEFVDVLPLVPGYIGEERACVFHGERVHLVPGLRLATEVPEARPDVFLRLEVLGSTSARWRGSKRGLELVGPTERGYIPPTTGGVAGLSPRGLTGDAARCAAEIVGGWARDGRVELAFNVPGTYDLRWAAYIKAPGERLGRVLGVDAPPTRVEVGGFGTRRIEAPFPMDTFAASGFFVASSTSSVGSAERAAPTQERAR